MASQTVLAALTGAVLDAAVSLGDGRAELLRAAGLDAETLADPDARVPLESHRRLWEAVARRPVGLALGQRLGLAGLGVVGYALPHGATVAEALELLSRHRSWVHADAVPRIEHRHVEGAPRVAFVQVVPPPFARLLEPVDAQAAATLCMVRALAGPDASPLRVALSRPPPTDARAHEAFYRCRVEWSAPRIEIVFDGSLLARLLPRSEPHLFGYLARRAETLAASQSGRATLADRARREIGERLVHGEPSLADVARRLAVSERTLHRRLGEEGTGFARLLDEARRERALLLLDDATLSASEIAHLLGYREPSAFFRAFRRWTGESPSAYRAARSAGA